MKFSQKDSRIAALEEREANLLSQLQFAVSKNDAKDKQIELLRGALVGMLEQFDSEEDCINEADYVAISVAKKALAATQNGDGV